VEPTPKTLTTPPWEFLPGNDFTQPNYNVMDTIKDTQERIQFSQREVSILIGTTPFFSIIKK